MQRAAASEPEDKRIPLRAEGLLHAMERDSGGVVMMSHTRGLIGGVTSPTGDPRGDDIRLAGFVVEDAVLLVVGNNLYRAESPDAAVAGRFSKMATPIPTDAHLFSSAGSAHVAYATKAPPRLFVSEDGGATFRPRALPGASPLLSLRVRRDGVIAVAHFLSESKTKWGGTAVEGVVHTWTRGAREWKAGPRARGHDQGDLIFRTGDHLSIVAVQGPDGGGTTLALDANGNWIPAPALPYWGYLSFAHPGTNFWISPEAARPPIPARGPSRDAPDGVLGGLGLGGLGRCDRVGCLDPYGHRSPAPRVKAYRDGVCLPEHVTTRIEVINVLGTDVSPARTVDHEVRECRKDAPPARTATLASIVPGATLRTAKLPATCARGEITGTRSRPMLLCDGAHAGEPGLYDLAGDVSPRGPRLAEGEIRELVAAKPKWGAMFRAALSSPDGTTVLVGAKHTILCPPESAGAPCRLLPHASILRALPVDGGHAVLLRQGANTGELLIDQTSTASSVRLRINWNLLDAELTDAGHIRLWLHPTLRRMPTDAERKKLPEFDAKARYLVTLRGGLTKESPDTRPATPR